MSLVLLHITPCFFSYTFFFITQKAVCRYRKTKLPWLTYKEEVLDWDPFISFVYDVISDSEAEAIRINSQVPFSFFLLYLPALLVFVIIYHLHFW